MQQLHRDTRLHQQSADGGGGDEQTEGEVQLTEKNGGASRVNRGVGKQTERSGGRSVM